MLRGAGDSFELGTPPFDLHLSWHIDPADPLYDADQIVWFARFRLVDAGETAYVPSEEIALVFTNRECEVEEETSEDCDGDGVLDSCTLAAFSPGVDADENGVLDLCECEPCGRSLPSDCNADGSVDIADALCILGHLFSGEPAELPCGDHSMNDFANVELLDGNGDEALDLSDGIHLLGYLFLGSDPPVLGERCRVFAGCPAVDGVCPGPGP
jgi:hypothetical protein